MSLWEQDSIETRDIKQRQAAQTPNVVFVIALHYQSLQIVVLLLKAVVHRLAHVPCNNVQNKFVGPTLNSKSRTVEQSSSILRFSTSSAALTKLFLLLDY